MKKLLLIAGCIALLTSCGGGKGSYGDAVVKDKNGDVVGYLSSSLRVGLTSINLSNYMMQDLNGNFAPVDFASGKLDRSEYLYFSTQNCGGSVYAPSTMINLLYKSYPFMTDSTRTTVDATAAEKVYNTTDIAIGTETVKSYLVLDQTYSGYNAYDTNTYKYICVTIVKALADAVTAGRATALGQCMNAGQITCNDDISTINSPYSSFCSSPSTPCVGTFTPYADQTSVQLTYETYAKQWGILTEVAAADITSKKVIVDYSAVAPLKVDLGD